MAGKAARKQVDAHVKAVADKAEAGVRARRGEPPSKREVIREKRKAKVAAEKAAEHRELDPLFTLDLWEPPTHSKSGRKLSASERARYAAPDTVSMRALSSAEKRAGLVLALSDGLSIGGACRKVGASRQFYYDGIHADEDFAKACADAVEDGTDAMEDMMTSDAMQPGNFLARIACLKARRRSKWADNAKTDLTVNVNAPTPEFDGKFEAFKQRVTGAFNAAIAAKPVQIEAKATAIDLTPAAMVAATAHNAKPAIAAPVVLDLEMPRLSPLQDMQRERHAQELLDAGILHPSQLTEDLKS